MFSPNLDGDTIDASGRRKDGCDGRRRRTAAGLLTFQSNALNALGLSPKVLCASSLSLVAISAHFTSFGSLGIAFESLP